jgi:hypothetical protein
MTVNISIMTRNNCPHINHGVFCEQKSCGFFLVYYTVPSTAYKVHFCVTHAARTYYNLIAQGYKITDITLLKGCAKVLVL